MILLGEILIFLCTGILTGLLSTLFGIGGGLIVVPISYLVFHLLLNYPTSVVMHLALGTSLTIMLITVVNSLYRHYKAGNILLKQVALPLIPYITLGALIGAYTSQFIHGNILRYCFMAFLAMIIINAFFDKDFKRSFSISDIRPFNPWLRATVGLITGAASVLLGVAGSIITLPYFRKHGVPMANAAASALCLAPSIAIVGMIGYLATGLDVSGLPPYSIGYINIPAAAAISAGTFIGAPLGVRLLTHFEDKFIAVAYVGLLILTLVLMAL